MGGPHTSKATMKWLKGHPDLVPPIKWPPYSADLSPIENLWSVLQDDVNRHNPATMDELEGAIAQSWNRRVHDIPFMEALLGGWRARMHELVRAEGGTLEY